jgi:hypothetical protein
MTFIGSRIFVAFLVVIITTGEAIALLFFLVGPSQHHIPKCYNRARSVSPEVMVQLLGSKAVVKAVDHVIACYVGDGSTRIEEPLYVRSQSFTALLFAQV